MLNIIKIINKTKMNAVNAYIQYYNGILTNTKRQERKLKV